MLEVIRSDVESEFFADGGQQHRVGNRVHAANDEVLAGECPRDEISGRHCRSISGCVRHLCTCRYLRDRSARAGTFEANWLRDSRKFPPLTSSASSRLKPRL